MLEVLLETDFNKLKTKTFINNIYAGIVYDKEGNPQKKILFEMKENKGFNVFNSENYPINKGEYYISEIVSLEEVIYDFFHSNTLNFYQLYMVYKMFLNDTKFINKNLRYFGMEEVPVGYDGKTKIMKSFSGYLEDKVDLYYGLRKIQNYKNIHKDKQDEKKSTK